MRNKFLFAAGLWCVVVFLFAVNQMDAKNLLSCAGISASGSMDYYSSYMWRGQKLDADPVFQPSLSLGGTCGFSINVWTSMPVSQKDDVSSDEIDLTLCYAHDCGPVSLSDGNINYQFPTGAGIQNEIFVAASMNSLPIVPSITYYRAYDNITGTYISLDVSKSMSLASCCEVTGTAIVHYGMLKDTGDISNGGDYSLSFKAGLPIADKLTLTSILTYMAPTGDLADEDIGNQKSALVGGLSLGFSF